MLRTTHGSSGVDSIAGNRGPTFRCAIQIESIVGMSTALDRRDAPGAFVPLLLAEAFFGKCFMQ